ncbi:hybrid sensor histidine kinase/response regulator [Xanthomonas theicola]|uniref:histidine kinase n=1 Tax=Xanthomonas theicola TaxID=56464 RepID=A0A2S6ZLD5_9XANT|nr:ATP-binding protein [Xanthomonas theicola]PPT93093.1 histidine kinase [Xanthomonas theicola]QNH24043.1 response regulator [Xanthomonas theicola]
MRSRSILGWWLLLWSAVAAAAVPPTPQPRQLTVADGLPSNSINGFAEDQLGYLWLASSDGLARFDGRGYRIWRVEDGLRDNKIWTVHVDAQNRVWFGTQNAGMGMLSADRRTFRYYDRSNFPQIGGATVWAITSTPDGSIWFGTANGGLNRLQPNGTLRRYMPTPGDVRSLPSPAVTFLATTPDGTLWAGTRGGLARWTGRDFERLPASALPRPEVQGLTPERDGALWVSSQGGVRLLRADGSVVAPYWRNMPGESVLAMLVHDRHGSRWFDTLDGLGREGDAGEIRNVPLYSSSAHGLVKPNWALAFEDREGDLWFASFNAGLWYLPANWRQFSVLSHRVDDPASMGNPYVIATAASADGGVWLAGTRGVLDKLDPATGTVRHHILTMFGRGWPRAIVEDDQGRVWAATLGSVLRYDPVTGEVRRWGKADGADAPLSGEIERMALGRDGRVWVFGEVAGVQVRDLEGRVLRTIAPGGGGLPLELTVEDAKPGPSGQPWLLGRHGVLAWNAARERFEPVPGAPVRALSAFTITDGNVVWLASVGRLERYLWDGERLSLLDRIDGEHEFPSLAPNGLVVDASGVAWMSSERGLLRVDPASNAIRSYGVHDGLPNQEFRVQTLIQARSGQILGGTPDGVVLFEPAQVVPSRRQPPLVIERIGVRRGDRALDLLHAGRIALQEGDRDLHIVARLLSFSDTDANTYRFRLSGYDPDWVDVGASGERLFSRLPAGHYTLETQARTADKVWSKVTTLRFRVLPPWWRSPWGLAGLALLALLALWLASSLYRRRLRRRNAWQLALHKQELAEQASLAKTRFLATLGHEVRTPMTGVLGMSELLLATPLDPRQRGYTESIRRAGTHLLRLVNDALDLARIEAGRLDLDQQPFDLGQLIAELEAMMAPMAHRRGLAFALDNAMPTEVTASGDATRVRQILLNLLNNAIKFTDHGRVALRIAPLHDNQGVRFEVADSGPGINAEQQARLFQRFEQADGSRTAARYGGSGLGLAICQELAVAMGGRIELHSRLGVGTRFVVDLPLPWIPTPLQRGTRGEREAPTATQPLRILLVEDDPTVAEVISGLLSARGHQITHAAHALAALTDVAASVFDVGLLDLDLPGLDGLALARQLRVFGYEMPLIAVTARADADAESHARAAGFDDFLRKPVTGDMLVEAIEAAMKRDAGRGTGDLGPGNGSRDGA